ncbi:MAG: hypothetical protein JSU70_01100 [Phycisphaerales bacterium]|nr:MAG: hypothetical protein JSU70_01100 [Phycisphaerales bacterium]
MKKLAVMCAMAVWLGSAGMVQAVRAPAPAAPFVCISVAQDKIELGTWPRPGRFSSSLLVRILANCPHRVEATFGAFKEQDGDGSIRPEQTYVTINGTDVPVAGGPVAIITSQTPTPIGGLEVPVELELSLARVGPVYRAGIYKGYLSLTVMTGV